MKNLLHVSVQLAAFISLANAQEEEPFIPPEFLNRATKSPALIDAIANVSVDSNTPPCLAPCPIPDITAPVLQKCIDMCFAEGFCCGNRLDWTDPASSNQRLSCANGCEIAYYSTKVEQCKASCETGNNPGCEYSHPYIKREFGKCGECQANCDGWPSEDACSIGCEKAEALDEFYKFEEPSDTCNVTSIPRFLFGGQSNMEGNPADAMGNQFRRIVKIINSKSLTDLKKKKWLRKAINSAEEAEPEPSINMRNLLWRMRKRLIRKKILNEPWQGATCSFTRPANMKNLDCERPVTPDACGLRGYGPELMFAHYFPTLRTKYKGQTIGITKVAQGGTIIKQWMKQYSSESDNYWNTLADAVEGSGGTFEGFVWFQGENDNFLDDDERAKYLERLTQFVSDVREEIFKTSTKFESKDDIPVVIVELGEWIRGGKGDGPGEIIYAQRKYVKSDPNSILVKTGASEDPTKRLSKFYHYDHASQLIIGHRVAKGLAKLVNK